MCSPTRRTLACYTPLHCAADNGNTATCALLLDRGADPNAKTNVCSVFLGSQSVSPACHCREVGRSVFSDTIDVQAVSVVEMSNFNIYLSYLVPSFLEST